MAETTLRRLLLVRGPGDPAHLCLVPVAADPPPERHDVAGFVCACGAVFDATAEPLSWTTEYDPRCLTTSMMAFDDRRKTS